MSDSDLVLSDFSVRYGQITAVDSISLAVEHGSIVAVLGANGAGKTSMLTALAGASLGRASGTVELFGGRLNIRHAHRVVRAGMVLVPEGRQVFAPLSVQDNLLVGGYIQGGIAGRGTGGGADATMAEIYDMFPVLHERRNSPAGLLSGGEQQMLAFGRAMMSQPKLILMDEPSMGLAPVVVDRVMAALRRINERGTSILVVEQNAAAVLEVAHHAYVLSRGRITHSGPAAEVKESPIVAQSFLGLDDDNEQTGEREAASAAS
jgi:branched-chain amino acid transport system ATP-binding protein